MKTDPYDGVYYINQASNLDDLKRTFERILAGYGFDLFAIQYTTTELKSNNAQPHFLCNFHPIWVDHYYSSKYYQIDPVILLGKEKRRPYFWDKLWHGVEMNSHQKEFFYEADEFGVASGLGLPVLQVNNEPGVISLVSSVCRPEEVHQIMQEDHLALALLSTTFHHAANKFFEKKPHPNAPQLTKREKECLIWAANGKTDFEIGLILNISHRTVNMHMSNSYTKLDCVSREQAVVKALLMKIINL